MARSSFVLHSQPWFTLFLLPNCDSQGRLCRDRHSHSLAFPTSRHRLQFRLLTLPCRIPRTELFLVTFSYLLLIICSGSLTNIATSQWLAHSTSVLYRNLWFTLLRCYILLCGSLSTAATSGILVHSAAMLYRWTWFTLFDCYIASCGSLLHPAISSVVVHSYSSLHRLDWFTHTFCYVIHMVRYSQVLHRALWLTLPRCYIVDDGSLRFPIISIGLAHSIVLLHQGMWFSLRGCYIRYFGSLYSVAISVSLAHS